MNYVIGVDNGNSNMKTAHTVFPCGYKMQETKPSSLFAKDVIEYDNKFYSLISTPFSYQTDKTTDEKAFILTLFAIAKEIVARASEGKSDFDFHKDFSGFIGKEVVLAVGLPPAHYEKQNEAFKRYFLNKSVHGIRFKYNDKSFQFYLKDVYVYPQDYAGAFVFEQKLFQEYSLIYCIDLGGGTLDMVGLEEGVPQKDTILSREIGIAKLKSMIIDDVINDYGVTLTDKSIDDFLQGKRLALAPDLENQLLSRIEKTTDGFVNTIINELHSKVSDFRVYPVVFLGGGMLGLKPYFDNSKAFGMTYYIDDIKANAIGYEVIAKAQMGAR